MRKHGQRLRTAIATEVRSPIESTPESVPAPAETSARRREQQHTAEPTTPAPKMTSEGHKNSRFLNKINASLSILGGWNSASQVFSRYHNKYNSANVTDIEIGLELLVDAGRVEKRAEKSGRTLYRAKSKVKAKPTPPQESGTKNGVVSNNTLSEEPKPEPKPKTDLSALLREVDSVLTAGALKEVSRDNA